MQFYAVRNERPSSDGPAYPPAGIVLARPGRRHSQHFSRLLATQCLTRTEERCPLDDRDESPRRGRLLHCSRGCEASCA